jgi:hypothetical protein
MAALYSDTLNNFLVIHPSQLLGILVSGLAEQGFDTTKLTTESWQQEIKELQTAFSKLRQSMAFSGKWQVLLEYVLPIVGQRVDLILLADDLIFVIEYKGGDSATAKAALRQAQEYALNLTDFHEESRGRIAIPIALGSFKKTIPLDCHAVPHRGTAILPRDLFKVISKAYHAWSETSISINPTSWNASRYFPVPTIIEAASAVYLDHDVRELASSRSGVENLEATQKAVAEAVHDARLRGIKKLLVITGVPGAGKTLAGLNAVQLLQRDLDLEHEQASFLSGNGPLVKVLQEALKRSIRRRKIGVVRSVQSRIREMHRFVRDSYQDPRPPADRLIVFDEAQRAWTAAKNLKKFGRDISEPEMVLEIMGRHQGWSVIVALVGGGQEIHGGEAGLAAWGDAIIKNRDWEVLASPEALRGGPSIAGSRLFAATPPIGAKLEENKSLHLSISKRTFDSEITAAWVNALLSGQRSEAAALASSNSLSIYLTRDLDAARNWLRNNANGERRVGLIASSGASRLRAEGVETPTFTFLGGIDYTKWFLEPDGDYRSSNQLEVALSEFELQGLEIDFSCLLWGGDLIFENGQIITRKLSAQRWVLVEGKGDPQASADDPRTRILNKYRVLLTRFRKAMVIFIPLGSVEDSTRNPVDFANIADYLISCGVKSLPS